MTISFRGVQGLKVQLPKQNKVVKAQHLYFGSQNADAKNMKKVATAMTVENWVYGFGKQALKLNFSFFKAFQDYQKDLKRMKFAFKEIEDTKKTELRPNGSLSEHGLKDFVTALRGGAEGMQKVLLSLGADKEKLTLRNGMALLMKEFNMSVTQEQMNAILMQAEGEEFQEKALYADLLARLETQACQDKLLFSIFEGGIPGIIKVFRKLDAAAMPSNPLKQSIEMLTEIENSLSSEADTLVRLLENATKK